MNKACRFLLLALLSSIQICFWLNPALAQPRLVLDGAKINIHNGAALVVANPAPDAIVRNSGHIISEGENNILQWHIGGTEGTFQIPWGTGSDSYIPLSFKKTGGEGEGYFRFSTYGTGWQNSSSLPSAIPALVREGADMSAQLVDRFWQIDAQGYTIKPSAANITFTYPQEGTVAEGNSITEDNLQAFRWNENLNQWDDYAPTSAPDPANKTVTLASVEGEQFYSWWFLADNAAPMPVELLFFSAKTAGKSVRLEWATASEQNSNFFIVERSKDGKQFEAVKAVKGAGNSSVRRDYEAWDYTPFTGTSYYRLKQTDVDGKFRYSGVQAVELSERTENKSVAYPNPTSTGKFFVEFRQAGGEEIAVELYDMLGRKVPVRIEKHTSGVVLITLGSTVSAGTYLLQVKGETELVRQKVIVQYSSL